MTVLETLPRYHAHTRWTLLLLLALASAAPRCTPHRASAQLMPTVQTTVASSNTDEVMEFCVRILLIPNLFQGI